MSSCLLLLFVFLLLIYPTVNLFFLVFTAAALSAGSHNFFIFPAAALSSCSATLFIVNAVALYSSSPLLFIPQGLRRYSNQSSVSPYIASVHRRKLLFCCNLHGPALFVKVLIIGFE